MDTIIIAGAIFNIGFAVFHIFFWKIFQWPSDLKSLSFLNRGIIQVLNLCLIFVFLIFGYISLFYTTALLNTGLGRTLLILISLFWFFRALEQIVFFKLRHWESWIFLLLFLTGTFLYAYPVIYMV